MSILERFGLKQQGYFLFLARLVQDKNPDFLIKGFIASQHKELKLVIAGNNTADAEYVNSLHRIAEGNEDVIFTGAVYDKDKEELLRNAFVFCLPSTIEGLSIGLLEAMSRKLPIIASDIEANREVLDENEAVWVRPENTNDIKEAIEYCIANPEKLEEYKEVNYRKVVENYTWEKVTQKYLDYLESIGVR